MSTTIIDLPSVDIDPFSDSTLAYPEPFWDEVRAAGPLVRLSGIEGHSVIATGRDQNVRELLANNTDFLSSRGTGIWDIQRGDGFRPAALLTETDEPAHSAYRKVMGSVISPQSLRALRTSFTEVAEDVVDRVLDLGEFDAYTELAVGFPLRVVPDAIMGAPEEGRENLLRYATFLFESLGPRTPRVERVFEEIGDVQAAIEWTARSCMRENVSPDSFGARIWAAVDRGELSAEDAPNLVRSLVGAGIGTTINSITITLHLLSTHPEQYALLHEQPTHGKFAYDEALRRHSPVRSVYRTPGRDLELLGVQLSEGQKIMSMPGSANLDPERWGDTVLDYDITRDTGGHLTFGFGIHACVGAAIARLEADVLLTAFAKRVRSIEPTAPAEPLLNNFLRGFASVPVRIKAA